MTWKGSRKKQLWLNYPANFLEELRKAKKSLSHNSWSLGQDLKPGSLKYKAGVLYTQL
jgi:hypothetical protein